MKRLLDWLLQHPSTDMVVGISVSLAAYRWFPAAGMTAEHRFTLYGTIASVAALLLAVVTFVRSVIEQSMNSDLRRIEQSQRKYFRANWRSAMKWSGLTAFGAILLFYLDSVSITLAVPLSVFLVAILLAKFLRTAFFYSYADRIEELSALTPAHTEVSVDRS